MERDHQIGSDPVLKASGVMQIIHHIWCEEIGSDFCLDGSQAKTLKIIYLIYI